MKLVVGENGRNPVKNLPRPRFVHHETHMEGPRRETRDPSGGRRAPNSLRHEAAVFQYLALIIIYLLICVFSRNSHNKYNKSCFLPQIKITRDIFFGKTTRSCYNTVEKIFESRKMFLIICPSPNFEPKPNDQFHSNSVSRVLLQISPAHYLVFDLA